MVRDVETWWRIQTNEGPRFCKGRGDLLEIGTGDPFCGWTPSGAAIPRSQARVLAPIIPGTFYAIGSNYRDHIEKMATAAGRKPIYYERPRVGYRANNALIGDGEAIVKPADAGEEFQYEAEIVAVVGETLRNVSAERARQAIFGWTIGNDVSERHWQKIDQTNIRAKNCDTFKPMGPCIARLPDISNCRTIVRLNDEIVHDFSTANMLFDAGEVIAEIARYNTLSPGDVVWLGTDDRPRNIKPGDRLEIEITGLGVLRNHVVAETREVPAT